MRQSTDIIEVQQQVQQLRACRMEARAFRFEYCLLNVV